MAAHNQDTAAGPIRSERGASAPLGSGQSGAGPAKLRRDLGSSVVIIAICCLLWWETTNFAEVPAALSQGISAAFFPRLILGSVIFLSILQIVRGWRLPVERTKKPANVTLVTAVAIVFSTALVPIIGILPVMLLVAIGLPFLWGERRWRFLLPYGLGLTLAIWIIFSQLLGLRFPTGLIPL